MTVLTNNGISKRNLYDRVKKLLVSFEWSDCSFLVSGKDFKAHKLLLGISSPVFEAMFYGPLSSNHDVIITDIEPDIFQLLINYIYTDNVEISSIDQAFELLYASRKYLLEHLTDMCIAYIQENISVDNVVEVLNYPDYLQDKQLISFALKLFCEHAYYLLQEKKHIISYPCMKMILDCNEINITEKDLIKNLFDWTTHYCKFNDIDCTFENRRKVLIDKGLFMLLRVHTLSKDDINEIIADENNLFLSYEVDQTERIKNHLEDDNIIYNSRNCLFNKTLIPRNRLYMQWHFCHRSPLRSVAPMIIDSNNYMVQSRIKTDKTIFINSLCIPTRMAPAVTFRNNTPKVYSEQFSISVLTECGNNVIKFTNFMNTVEYNSFVDIELGEPCLIKKDEWHIINFVWPQNIVSYSYVVEVRDRMYKGQKITIEFDDSCSTGSCGSFIGGLKYCL